MRPQAHRPRSYPTLRRVAWCALIAVLVVMVAIAWCAVPEPELLAIR
jgi:hypothetical protein